VDAVEAFPGDVEETGVLTEVGVETAPNACELLLTIDEEAAD